MAMTSERLRAQWRKICWYFAGWNSYATALYVHRDTLSPLERERAVALGVTFDGDAD